MTTELERLKAWMAENNYDTTALAKHLRIKYSSLYKMLSDRGNISASFKWKFYLAFGPDLSRSLFDMSGRKPTTHPRSESIISPERYAAHQAVARAIRKGELLPAKTYKCHACDKKADQYHHSSYDPADRLCVVPLCRSCHGKANRNSLGVDLGVVPTAVGLIRIAIATTPEQTP